MMEPNVRLMILCEDARLRKGSAKKFDLFGVTSTVSAPPDAFPICLTLCAYLCLTECRGRASVRIIVIEEETDEIVFTGDEHSYELGADPIALRALTVPIPFCLLPRPGLYRAEFVYNNVSIGECPLLAKETQ